MNPHAPSTVVIGLGNPILSDDSAGWRVVDCLEDGRLSSHPALAQSVAIERACVGGLSLAELMAGYDRAIIIDAMLTGVVAAGTVSQVGVGELPGVLNVSSAHDTNLSTALLTLRRHGVAVPDDDAISLITIEVQDVWTFGEQCSAPVEAAIPIAAALVWRLVAENWSK